MKYNTINPDNKKRKNIDKKQIEINEIIATFKFNKEALLIDQYNNNEFFNKIRKIAKTKGGFLNNNNRKILYDYLFYKKKNKKGIIDIIKINKNIELFISKINVTLEKKELTEEKLNSIDEYKIILNDMPRTCKNIISKDTNNKINNLSNSSINNLITNKMAITPEIFIFTCEKMGYKYLQGLLNIIFYFKKLFNYENCINSLNIYFEYFFKDFIDKELSEENGDANIPLISSIIIDLFKYLYPNENSDKLEEIIPILCNKWIISDFISEITDINKGFRVLDYLIVSEPYIKYILSVVLINKYNNIILNKMKVSIDSSYDNILNELKKDDLNMIDFDEVIEDTEKIYIKKGKDIKTLLIEKYGKNYAYTFNLNNQGLISYYKNLVKILEIKKPKTEFKINFENIKYCKYIFIAILISIFLYYIYHFIDKNRYFW